MTTCSEKWQGSTSGRSGACEANGWIDEQPANRIMATHPLSILTDRPEVGPCQSAICKVGFQAKWISVAILGASLAESPGWRSARSRPRRSFPIRTIRSGAGRWSRAMTGASTCSIRAGPPNSATAPGSVTRRSHMRFPTIRAVHTGTLASPSRPAAKRDCFLHSTGRNSLGRVPIPSRHSREPCRACRPQRVP